MLDYYDNRLAPDSRLLQSPAVWPETELAELPDDLREVTLDLLSMALDMAGILDPTPVSDGASGILALTRGKWLDAVISGVSLVPYIGDLAKVGKLGRYAQTLDRAIRLAISSPRAARALRPGLDKLLQLLDLFPPNGSKMITGMKARLRQFFATRPATAVVHRLPDIRHRFRFSKQTVVKNRKTFEVQEAAGRLGVPGKVRSVRDEALQTSVSAGSGDHAGHLIAAEFGAPGGAKNLTMQNWIQNSHGNWRKLEQEWGQKLRDGIGIEVKVRDYIPVGTGRPSHRIATWTEIGRNGSRRTYTREFTNTHTADWLTKKGDLRTGSRTAQKVKPTEVGPEEHKTIHTDFMNKGRPHQSGPGAE